MFWSLLSLKSICPTRKTKNCIFHVTLCYEPAVNRYGTWRLHAKIVPEWLPAREPGRLTYRVPEEKEEEEVSKESEEAKDRKEEEEEEGGIFDKFGRRIFGKK